MPRVSAARVAEILAKVERAEIELVKARRVLEPDGEGAAPSREATNTNSGINGTTPQHTPVKWLPRGTSSHSVGMSKQDRDKCWQVFLSVDKDGSGKVGIMELEKMLADAGSSVQEADVEGIRAKIQEHDKNFDGQLDFEEFCQAFCLTKGEKVAQRQAKMESLKKSVRDAAAENMPPEQHVRIYGVPPSAVKRYLRKELDETSACLQLPQACAILVFFYLAVTLHFKLDHLYGMDHAITFDVLENANFAFSGIVPFEGGRMGHKNFEDVNSIADFWSFMNMGITPLFWPAGWDTNEVRGNVAARCTSPKDALDGWGGYTAFSQNVSTMVDLGAVCPEGHDSPDLPSDTAEFFGGQSMVDGRYLLFNSVLGGVRLRQERADLGTCIAEERDTSFFSSLRKGKCLSRDWPNNRDYWLIPELQMGLDIEKRLVNKAGGETKYLLSGQPQSAVRDELRELENRAWFSPQTTKIELCFPTYNAEDNLITATYVMLFVNKGGHFHKLVEPVSFYLNPYHDAWCYIMDFCWLFLILKLFLEESVEVVKHWRQLGCIGGSRVYLGNLANFVDWISIISAFVLVALWAVHIVDLKRLEEILARADASTSGHFVNSADREEFFEIVDVVVSESHVFRNMLAIYPAIVVSRFFKAFASQPRLAMVTNTLYRASSDIFHFVIVFFTVFVVFSLSAMILWGQELEHFSTSVRSVHSAFRILLGDFEWEQLTGVGRLQSMVWFWLFMWLVNLVMLNMLLAIIMDVYTDVKSGLGKAETLWTQSVEIVERWYQVQFGPNLKLKSILKALDPTDLEDDDEPTGDEEALFLENFTVIVPHLPQTQAMNILMASHELRQSDNRGSDSLTEMTGKVIKIDNRTRLLSEQLNRLIQLQATGTGPNTQSSVSI